MTANLNAMTVAVIGGGSIGVRHIGNLKTLGAGVIVVEKDAARRAYISETYEVPVYADHRRALPQAAAAVICTPTAAHLAPVRAALAEGCHVLVEKPISHTLTGVDGLIRTAAEAGLVLMVGYNFRFHPAFTRLREMLHAGAIGKLLEIKAHAGSYFLYRAPFHTWQDFREDYAARRVGGGVILDSGSHHIDYISSLCGWPDHVFCEARRAGGLQLEAEDVADILMHYPDGPVVNLHVNFVQQPYRNSYELIGEKGTLNWNVVDNLVRHYDAAAETWREYPVPAGFDHNQTYLREVEVFLDCIVRGTRPSVDGTAGKRVLRVALAARRAAASGRVVRLKWD